MITFTLVILNIFLVLKIAEWFENFVLFHKKRKERANLEAEAEEIFGSLKKAVLGKKEEDLNIN